MKSHGGEITVSSVEHQGTTFEIFLPQAEIKAVETKPKDGVACGGHERILLVDDEEALVFMMQQILEKLGYRVTAFSDSREALRSLRADPTAFDLVITDQTMPNLTGSELTAEVLKIRPELPVIICTGYDRNAMTSTSGLFIIKPVDVRLLAEMIRKALSAQAGSSAKPQSVEQNRLSTVKYAGTQTNIL